MNDPGYVISKIFSFSLLGIMLFGFFCWRYHGPFGVKVKNFLHDVKRIITAPLYYFHGYKCDICGKEYLNRHKAFMCCPNPRNAEYRRKHPNEKCLTDPKTLSSAALLRLACCEQYHSMGGASAGPITHTCTWCGGTGQKFGVMCDECGGKGWLPGPGSK